MFAPVPLTTLTPRLPLEICDLVVNEVISTIWDLSYYSEYNACKKLLALFKSVCCAWVPRFQLHIFKVVILNSPVRIEKFLDTLSNQPEYSALVESLEVAGKSGMNVLSCKWIHRALSTLPHLLSNLHTLIFHNFPVLHPLYVRKTPATFQALERPRKGLWQVVP